MELSDALDIIRNLPNLHDARRRALVAVAVAVELRDRPDELRRHAYRCRAEDADVADRATRWFQKEVALRQIGSGCPFDHSHGKTETCFRKHGCRCNPCVDHMSEVKSRRRKERSDASLSAESVRHGTWSGYSYASCRCGACVAAGAAYRREYKKSREAQN